MRPSPLRIPFLQSQSLPAVRTRGHRPLDRPRVGQLVGAPYFLVTFTFPSELRGCFFGAFAKEAYDMFFAASSQALAEKLAAAKGLRAHISGFTAVTAYLEPAHGVSSPPAFPGFGGRN